VDDVLLILAFAYMGGVQANFFHDVENGSNPFNPADWNWKSPRTYIGVASGAFTGYSYGLEHCEYLLDVNTGIKEWYSPLGEGKLNIIHKGYWVDNHTAFLYSHTIVKNVPLGGVDNIRSFASLAYLANATNVWLSNVWNNSDIGKTIPDVLYFNFGSTLTFLGGGSYSTGYALQLKGKEGVNLYSTLTLNAKAGGHFSLWNFNVGYSSYIGDSRNFSIWETFEGSGTRGFEIDAVYGIMGTLSPIDPYGSRLYSYEFGIGYGIGGSVNVGSKTYISPIKAPWKIFR
jgi:hypothetical protein